MLEETKKNLQLQDNNVTITGTANGQIKQQETKAELDLPSSCSMKQGKKISQKVLTG